MHPRKILSVAVPISSDKNISSDEDKNVRRGIVNSNDNYIVYQSTESNYWLLSKDKQSDHDLAHDHEPWRHHFNTTAAGGKASSKEKKSCASDWLLGHLTKSQKEIQFVMTQNQAAL